MVATIRRVFVDAARPSTARIGEVDFHPGGLSLALMLRHFPALFASHRHSLMSLDAMEHMVEAAQRRFRTGVLYPG